MLILKHHYKFSIVFYIRIVAAWTAMEHIDDNNGCLVVQPGTKFAKNTFLIDISHKTL